MNLAKEKGKILQIKQIKVFSKPHASLYLLLFSLYSSGTFFFASASSHVSDNISVINSYT